MISDSAERLSCTQGGTGSRNKAGVIDSAVAAALFTSRHLRTSHSSDAFGLHSSMEF